MGTQNEAQGQPRGVLRFLSSPWLARPHQAFKGQSSPGRALNYLLDTNVVSEWVKAPPHANVVRWLAETDEDRICLSVITFAEIRQGVEEMVAGRRRDALTSWLQDELPSRFEGRILGVDLAVAEAWGAVMARSNKMGVNLGVMDAFFAATAEARGLTLVTRNTRHFETLGMALVNPWIEKH
jgi:toxin FitB